MLLILTGAVIFDLAYDRIPNRYLIAGFMFLTYQNLVNSGIAGTGKALLTCLLPFLVMFPLFALGLFGAGDIKCLCLTGLVFPPHKVMTILFAAIIVGSFIGVAKLIRYGFHGGEFVNLMRYLIKKCLNFGMQNAAESISYVSMGRESVRERGIHFSLPILVATAAVTWSVL